MQTQDFEFLWGRAMSKLFPGLRVTTSYHEPKLSAGQVSSGAFKTPNFIIVFKYRNCT